MSLVIGRSPVAWQLRKVKRVEAHHSALDREEELRKWGQQM